MEVAEKQALSEDRVKQLEAKRIKEEVETKDTKTNEYEETHRRREDSADTALQEEFKFVQDKLNETRNQQMDTDLDKTHRVNLKLGRDETLAEIQRGSTKRTVEMFENM